MSLADTAINEIIGIEGGFSDHPSDAGGKTRFGITEYLARAYGYTGEMKDFPHTFARYIYREEFWGRMNLDEVGRINFPVARELFEAAVNLPMGRVVGWFQRSLNVFNRQARDYHDLVVDEHLGPATVAAFKAFMLMRGKEGEKVMLRALNCFQGAYYVERAEARQANEIFVFGWMLHRVTP